VRVTYVCHACMLIETKGVRILTDPWIHGPCFYGTWYQLPEPLFRIEDLLPLDYIYISHSHPDHLHAPTLARVPKETQLIIPGEEPYQRGALKSFGFQNILEVEHGTSTALKNGVRLTLFKHSWDSMIIVEDGKSSYLNLTDCRLEHVIHRIRRDFRIDVAFLPFLDAMDFPAAFDLTPIGRTIDQREVDRRTAAHFINMALALNTKTVVPSASHKVFLHPSQWHMNERITPYELAENCRHLAPQVDFRYLSSGDFWDSDGQGRSSAPPNATQIREQVRACYQRRKQEVDQAFESYSTMPTPQHGVEIQSGIKTFFESRLRQLSWHWRRILNMKVEFECPDLETPFQLVDVGQARVSEPRRSRFSDAEVTFTLPSSMLEYVLLQDKDLWNDARTSNRVLTRVNKPLSIPRIKLFAWLLTWHFNERGLFKDMLLGLRWPLVRKYHFGRFETVKHQDLQLTDDEPTEVTEGPVCETH
jgi:L-ascorbate metabolism protein UlaG (beta-lactamase superfamily)